MRAERQVHQCAFDLGTADGVRKRKFLIAEPTVGQSATLLAYRYRLILSSNQTARRTLSSYRRSLIKKRGDTEKT